MRKKKSQQDDSEKLQALLQSWNISFPETSLNDFPKANFPETAFSPSETKEEIPEPVPPTESENSHSEPEEKIPEPVPSAESLRLEPLHSDLTAAPMSNPSRHQDFDLNQLFKTQIIQSLHGTVRMISFDYFVFALVLCLYGIYSMHGIKAIISVFCFLAAFLWIWYMFSWKLTFNGETNRFSFCSLFREEITFHASEIENLTIEEHYFRRSMKEVLMMTVHSRKIIIVLGYPDVKTSPKKYFGGYPNAQKLLSYLNYYQELHGDFRYSHLRKYAYVHAEQPNSEKNSSSKEELMELLSKYQQQINQNQRGD